LPVPAEYGFHYLQGLAFRARTRYDYIMMNETTMTLSELTATAADRYEVNPTEITTTEAPNGGTAIWHSFCDEDRGLEDDFCLCWQKADGTVIWDEDPYGWNEVATAAGY
jgi:hypothetical protein